MIGYSKRRDGKMNRPSRTSINDKYGSRSNYVVEFHAGGSWFQVADYSSGKGILSWRTHGDAVIARDAIYAEWKSRESGRRRTSRRKLRVSLYARVEANNA